MAKTGRTHKGSHKGSRKGSEICSFCGKTARMVVGMVQGPGSLYICNECVEQCHQILDAEFSEEAHGQGHGGGVVPLIEVKAAVLKDHRRIVEPADSQFAAVPNNSGFWESGDLRVRDTFGVR